MGQSAGRNLAMVLVVVLAGVSLSGCADDDNGASPSGSAAEPAASDGTAAGGTGTDAPSADVAVVVDEPPRAIVVSGTVGTSVDMTAADGGTASVVAEDGTTYVLMIPPDVLPVDTTLDMFPAEGDGLRGVTIEPDGLFLNGTALLTVTPPDGDALGEPLWWDGSGVVRSATAATDTDGSMVFLLAHFSGYGSATTPQGAPTPTAMDRFTQSTAQLTAEAMRTGDLSDVDRQILDDGARAVWESTIKPWLEGVGQAGCNAEAALHESMRFVVLAQALGLSVGDDAAEELNRRAPEAYDAMKRCAEERCDAGDLGAAQLMVRALTVGQNFGVDAAAADVPVILPQLFGPVVSSRWARCRALAFSMHAQGHEEIQWAGRQPTRTESPASAIGVLMPSEDGHAGEVGMWLAGSGYDPTIEWAGVGGEVLDIGPQDPAFHCDTPGFDPGYAAVTVHWDGDTPSIDIVPMVSTTVFPCGELTFDFPHRAFMNLGARLSWDGVNDGALHHTFTPDEAWPSASLGDGRQVALGYRWEETFDVSDIYATAFARPGQVAWTKVVVRIGLATETSPSIARPADAGLVNGLLIIESM